MKKVWEAGMILLAMMSFWGMIYPDLCFTQDVCRVVYTDTLLEEETEEERSESRSESRSENRKDGEEADDMFTQICGAAPGQIRIKFRLFADRTESKGKEDVRKREHETAP